MGKQNILITGISGQDGAFLANRFLSDNSMKYNIYGTSRQKSSLALKKIKSDSYWNHRDSSKELNQNYEKQF